MIDDLKYRLFLTTQILLQLAVGNFYFTIPERDDDKETDHLLKQVTSALEHLQLSLHTRRAATNTIVTPVLTITFLLDRHFRIKKFEQNDLTDNVTDITGLEFSELVTLDYLDEWRRIREGISTQDSHVITFQLRLKLPCSSYCLCILLRKSKAHLIVIYSLFYNINDRRNYGSNKEYCKTSLSEQLRHYILANLDVRLPPTKHLARMLGTNEFYLKKYITVVFTVTITSVGWKELIYFLPKLIYR